MGYFKVRFQSTTSPTESLFNVEKAEIDIQRKCVDRINVKPIPGTMKIHGIKGVRSYEIKMKTCHVSALHACLITVKPAKKYRRDMA